MIEIMVEISTLNYFKALMHWEKSVFPDHDQHFKIFDEFVGIPLNAFSDSKPTIYITDESARRIKMLLGPHYKTIIKAYLVKYHEQTHETHASNPQSHF